MKTQIDNLVRNILHDLVQPPHSVAELAAFYQLIGADGPSKARAQRTILASWAENAESLEIRAYAQQQLEMLPAFD